MPYHRDTNRLRGLGWFLWGILAAALIALAGCVYTRTTAPDGTVVDQWVPDAALVRDSLAALPTVLKAIEDVKKDPEITPEERSARLEELQLKLEALKEILNAAGQGTPVSTATTSAK
jgi:hypothetical protein